jgi:hypothetical protein
LPLCHLTRKPRSVTLQKIAQGRLSQYSHTHPVEAHRSHTTVITGWSACRPFQQSSSSPQSTGSRSISAEARRPGTARQLALVGRDRAASHVAALLRAVVSLGQPTLRSRFNLKSTGLGAMRCTDQPVTGRLNMVTLSQRRTAARSARRQQKGVANTTAQRRHQRDQAHFDIVVHAALCTP